MLLSTICAAVPSSCLFEDEYILDSGRLGAAGRVLSAGDTAPADVGRFTGVSDGAKPRWVEGSGGRSRA